MRHTFEAIKMGHLYQSQVDIFVGNYLKVCGHNLSGSSKELVA
jgi:hypothetical protein